MIKTITIKNTNSKTKIIVKNNYFVKYLNTLLKSRKKVFCLIDNKLKKFVSKSLDKKKFNCIYIKCGENIKDIKSYSKICEKLLTLNIDRDSIVVSIGGGTLGDLSGYIASTLLRGVDYKLIPTTLLSQVDSSIGGKNGINTKFGKNLIGTFYHPSEVIIDTEFLKTLSLREIKSGYVEILKHSLINDYSFFKWLDKNHNKIFNLENNVLEKAILKSINIKLFYVNNDTKEKLTNYKSRAILNFGHTIGHAIENYHKYSKKIIHGEAVSIGMYVESLISNKLGYLPKEKLSDIENHYIKAKLKKYDLSLKSNKVLKAITKDKKNINNKINLILISNIGVSFYKKNLGLENIKKIITNI